jgi:hypothetical protein
MSEVTLDIDANDNASATIDNIGNSLNGLNSSAQNTGMGMGDLTSTFASATRIGSSAMIAMDRIQVSMDAVSNAQIRVQMSQENLTLAVQKYGAGSIQAEQAQQRLTISTNSLNLAQEREEVRMIYATLTVIPQMIKGAQNLIQNLTQETAATDGSTAAIEANTTARLANIAVATLGLAVPIAMAAMTAVEMEQQQQQNNLYGNMNVTMTGPSSSPAAFGQGFAAASRG